MTSSCTRCGGSFRIEKHHIKPRTQGGSDNDENLVALCAACHDEIHTGVTHNKPAKLTGSEFWEWVEQYDGPPKEPWTMAYLCNHCGNQWEGKPIQERTATKISCSRTNCMGSAYIPVTDDVVVDAYSIKQLLNESDAIDYRALEIESRRWRGLSWLPTTNMQKVVKIYDADEFSG